MLNLGFVNEATWTYTLEEFLTLDMKNTVRPGQTTNRNYNCCILYESRQARVLYESFLKSHVLVKREQELHER